MSDQRLEKTKTVFYVLQRGKSETLKLRYPPKGWDEDDLEIVRDKKNHGIMTQFTGKLEFRARARDFINRAYFLNGINADLYLIKYVLRDGESYVVGDDVNYLKFRVQYKGIADFETKKEKNGVLSINFNSRELYTVVKSHETDEFEIDRTEDINGNGITDINFNSILIKGRELSSPGSAINQFSYQTGSQAFNIDRNKITVPTKFINKGFDRHVEVTDALFDPDSSLGWQANFFYNDLIDAVPLDTALEIRLKFNMNLTVVTDDGYIPKIAPYLKIYFFQEDKYTEYLSIPIGSTLYDNGEQMTFDGIVAVFDYGIQNYWAMAIEFEVTNFNNVGTGLFDYHYNIQEYQIDLVQSTKFDDTGLKYSFAFINEVASRTLEIITGDRFKFYSKAFGRNVYRTPPSGGAITQYQDYDYTEDGEWGNIGLIHGFDIRRFSKLNDLYKGLTTSFEGLMNSIKATFNVGIGIEDSAYGERYRCEPLEYFYRSGIVVEFPHQVSDVSREVEKSMFNSGCSFGQENGGNYEQGLGLDEPNVTTDFVTPIRKSENKYVKMSSVRSDDTGMEIVRRHPEWLDKTADRNEDSAIWYLDTKVNPDYLYEQLDWEDALAQIPEGVFSPETYKSWRFTPKRCMLRHGWVLRAGMEHASFMSKPITIASSKSNINLKTKYLPDVAPSETTDLVDEKTNIQVNKLNRSILLPEKITFKHPVTDELMDWIMGTTEVEIGGEVEEVPNWYFKMKFKNENGNFETGYLVSLKPRQGVFEFYKANENLIL